MVPRLAQGTRRAAGPVSGRFAFLRAGGLDHGADQRAVMVEVVPSLGWVLSR
ncbi:hypothetical protein [Yoonia sp.]|uniref:hypothetical protein n=1 Tax=Yoonia sp. TaxID=2212373 RepID=UPI0039749462